MAIGTPADIGSNATTGTAVTSLSITLAAPVAAGSLLVVAIANHNTGTVVPDSVTDTAGNTYTLISAANSSAVSGTLAYCGNCAALSSGNTITVSFPSSRNIAMRAYSVSGMQTSPFDVSATNAAGSGTSASVGPTATTAQADELIFAVFGYQNSRTFTAGTGYTAGTKVESTTTVRGVVAEWKIVSATGTQTPDGTWSSSTTFAGVVATFKGETASAKTASDSATLGEAASLTPSLAPTDSGTLADTSSLAASTARTDSGTLADTSSLAVAISVSDTATLADSSSLADLGTVRTATEAGALGETASVAASASATDSASLSDAAALAASAAGSDSSTLGEQAQIGIAPSDTAALGDSSSLAAALARVESITLGEQALVTIVIILHPSAALAVAVPLEFRSTVLVEQLVVVVPAEGRSA